MLDRFRHRIAMERGYRCLIAAKKVKPLVAQALGQSVVRLAVRVADGSSKI